MSAPRAAAAILCGGRSSRMGRDKSVIEIGGVPLAARVASTLAVAGASPAVAIGGDADALGRAGLVVVPDDRPGDGPLAGMATALRHAATDVLVIAACDLVHLSAAAVTQLLDELDGTPQADVAVPILDGHWQAHLTAWRVDRAVGRTEAAVAEGVRAVHELLVTLAVRPVLPLDPGAFRDADEPGDLPQTR